MSGAFEATPRHLNFWYAAIHKINYVNYAFKCTRSKYALGFQEGICLLVHKFGNNHYVLILIRLNFLHLIQFLYHSSSPLYKISTYTSVFKALLQCTHGKCTTSTVYDFTPAFINMLLLCSCSWLSIERNLFPWICGACS